MRMKFIFTLWISKLVAIAVNLIDRSRGSNYAGKIATRLMPDFVRHFKGLDYSKVIFITGTNGKSTTTNLVYHSLTAAGKRVASNLEGANMMGGVATTLIKNSTLGGKFNKEYLVLEIDERSLPAIRKVLPAGHMGITNLQKDQVQRNGDPDFILRKFRSAIGKDMTLYLNNEEPRSKALEDYAGKSIYFGAAANEKTYESHDFYDVTMPCPKCGHPIAYSRYHLASIGTFACTHCGHHSEAKPDVLAEDIDFAGKTFRCGGLAWSYPYANPFYIYNYAMDIAICRNLGLSDETIRDGIACFVNPAHRREVLTYRGKHIHYLRMKQENPETLQSALDTIAEDKSEKAVFMGMYEVKDFLPYYSNSFYFFDCNFTPIAKTPVERYVVFSTTVCYDTANRIRYAGAPEERITVLDTEDIPTILAELDKTKTNNIYFLTGMKPYKELKKYFKQGGGTNG